eukprot:scaffold4395_cov123-Isochrysis_galbana.AAC.2
MHGDRALGSEILPAYQAHSNVPPSLVKRFCSTAVPRCPTLSPVARWKASSDGPNAPTTPPLMNMHTQYTADTSSCCRSDCQDAAGPVAPCWSSDAIGLADTATVCATLRNHPTI